MKRLLVCAGIFAGLCALLELTACTSDEGIARKLTAPEIQVALDLI